MYIHYELVHIESVGIFTVQLHTTPEDTTPDWDFDSEEEKAELIRKIENGSMLYFCARVTVSVNGIPLETEYLGGCCYKSIEDFIDDDYYKDMKDSAIEDARRNYADLANTFRTEYIKK